MPAPVAGRELKRSSKNGPSGNEAYKSVERREKGKSSQVYDGRRRGSEQPKSSLAPTSARPHLQGRTNSSPLIHRPGEVDGLDGRDGKQHSEQDGQLAHTRAGADRMGLAQDADEVAGVVGAVKKFQPFRSPEVREAIRIQVLP